MSNESLDDSQASAHIIKPKLHLIDVEEKRGRRLHLKSINSVIEPRLISCLIQNLEKKRSYKKAALAFCEDACLRRGLIF